MFKSHLARTILCLTLVFVLVFNIYAIPTKASVAGTAVTVAAGLFVAAALVGLGISAGSSLDDFNSITSSCTSTLQQAGVIGDYVTGYLCDGKVNFWERLIDAVRSWTFDQEIIDLSATTCPIPVGQQFNFNYRQYGSSVSKVISSSIPISCCYLQYGSSLYFILFQPLSSGSWSLTDSDGNSFVGSDNGSISTNQGSVRYMYANSTSLSDNSFCNFYFETTTDTYSTIKGAMTAILNGVLLPTTSGICSPFNISIGSVAPPDVDLSTGYSDWSSGAVSVPGSYVGADTDEDVLTYPLGLGDTVDDTASMSQSDVQAGTGTYTGEAVAPDDGSGSDGVSDAVTGTLLSSLFAALQNFLKGKFDSLINLTTVVRDWCSDWWDKLGTTFPAILSEWWSTVWTHIDVSFDTALIGIRDGISGIKQWVDTAWDDFITTFPTAMSKWWEDVWTHVDDTFDSVLVGIRDGIAGIRDWADVWWDNLTIVLPNTLAKWWERVWADARSIPAFLTDALENLKTGILEGIEAVFVPPDDYLSDKLEAIKAKYSFVDSILSTAAAIGSSISFPGSEPPVIYVHLEDAEGNHSYGGTVAILDMNWYAEYKPTVDKLLAAFLWICFAWKIFKKAPGIISGAPDDVDFSRINLPGIASKGSNSGNSTGLRRLH